MLSKKEKAPEVSRGKRGVVVPFWSYTNTTYGARLRLTFDYVRPAAEGRWKDILAAVGVDPAIFNKKEHPCPRCGGNTRIRCKDPDAGKFFCHHCGGKNGTGGPIDGFELIQGVIGGSPKDALYLVASKLGITSISPLPNLPSRKQPAPSKKKTEDPEARQQLDKIISEARPSEPGELIHRYINEHRGLDIQVVPADLMTHDGMRAMVAPLRNLKGDITGAHKTYLTRRGTKKRRLYTSAIYPGAMSGSAVQLYEPTDTLGLAEGVETALACYLATAIPVWAATSRNLLEKVEIPTGVKQVTIFADNDKNGDGQMSARILEERLLNEGIATQLLIPPENGVDWCDVVTRSKELQNLV